MTHYFLKIQHPITSQHRCTDLSVAACPWCGSSSQQQMNGVCVLLVVDTDSQCLVLHWNSSPAKDTNVECKDNKLPPSDLHKCVWGRCFLQRKDRTTTSKHIAKYISCFQCVAKIEWFEKPWMDYGHDIFYVIFGSVLTLTVMCVMLLLNNTMQYVETFTDTNAKFVPWERVMDK